MKKISLLFLILLCIAVTLCGCTERDFVKATDGDFSVSLPNDVIGADNDNDSSATVSAEETDFIGVWRLNTVSSGASNTTYSNSYYIFSEDGSYSLAISGQTSSGRFSVNDDTLYLGNTPLTFEFDGDELTLYTKSGKVHNLTKINEGE